MVEGGGHRRSAVQAAREDRGLSLRVECEQCLAGLAGNADHEIVGTERAGAVARHRRRQGHDARPVAVDGQAAQGVVGERIRATLHVDEAQRVADLGDGQPVGAHRDDVGHLAHAVDTGERRGVRCSSGCGR